MGWLIRFIHNRDLAVENIAKAYVRRCFMLSAPTPTLRALRTAVAIGGVNLSYGTIVGGVSSSAPRGRSAPGEYAVDYVATARTSRVVDLLAPDAPAGSPQATLRPLMRGLARRHDLGEPHLGGVLHMQSAVRINGRPYRAGDYFEYLRPVPRNQHSSSMDDEYKGVGRVVALFLMPTSTQPEGCVVISFGPVHVRSREGNLILLENPSLSAEGIQCVHVDSIIFKLRVVPSDDVALTGLHFAMRMWEAR